MNTNDSRKRTSWSAIHDHKKGTDEGMRWSSQSGISIIFRIEIRRHVEFGITHKIRQLT